MKHTYEYQNRPYTIDLQTGQAVFDGKTVSAELLRIEGARLDLLIDGRATSAFVTQDGEKRWVTVDGQTLLLTRASAIHRAGSSAGLPENQLEAQMSGLVRAVLVAEGEQVKKGQTLAVIEAMKMENKLSAPFDGLVKKINLKVGQTVERGQVLIEINKGEQPGF